MNAVERLLAQGEQLISLYDEMLRERLGDRRDPDLPAVPQESIFEIGQGAISAVPQGSYWVSTHWLQAAAEAAWLEAKAANVEVSSKQVIARTTEILRDRLSQREQLLSDATWRRLLADVVFESRAWEPLAERVVKLAEQVSDAASAVGMLDAGIEPKWWWHARFSVHLQPLSSTTSPALRAGLRQALDRLHPYAQPPTAVTTIRETAGGGRRPHPGGRRKKYPAKKRQAIIADRKQEERKKAPEPLKTWLTTWATKHDMTRADALKMYNAEMAAIRRAHQARSR